jgi:hypothetical protein
MSRVLRRTALVTYFVVCTASVARAQTAGPPSPDPLAAARALFVEALHDEEAGRFADALEKFERVRAVRDTPAIEYRIGTCHEGLGEPVPAYRAYLAAQALGRADPQSADITHAASDRLDALSKDVARLTLVMPTPAPATEAPAAPKERPPAPGWLAIGGAVALTTASAILLVSRHDAIGDLNRACPGGICPPGADADGLESTRSRALVEGPVGIACGAAGVALAAFGVYWLVSRHASAGPAVAVVPTVARTGAGLALTGAFR